MKIRTQLKAGARSKTNHNETLQVRTGLQGGGDEATARGSRRVTCWCQEAVGTD